MPIKLIFPQNFKFSLSLKENKKIKILEELIPDRETLTPANYLKSEVKVPRTFLDRLFGFNN